MQKKKSKQGEIEHWQEVKKNGCNQRRKEMRNGRKEEWKLGIQGRQERNKEEMEERKAEGKERRNRRKKGRKAGRKRGRKVGEKRKEGRKEAKEKNNG